MSGKKRSFIAVRFSEDVVSALDDLQSSLKQAVGPRAKVKWVKPKNIHLTLQFLEHRHLNVEKATGGMGGHQEWRCGTEGRL